MKNARLIIMSFLSLFVTFQSITAYNIRQITNKDGLSNSAILSLHQDTDGFIWLGTADGLNRYDGAKVIPFQINNETRGLSGNIIEKITETNNNTFWIHTNYGLDKVDKLGRRISFFPQFQGQYLMNKNNKGHVFIVNENNILYYYNTQSKKFDEISLKGIDYHNLLNFVITDTNILQFFTRDGLNPRFQIKTNTDGGIDLDLKHYFSSFTRKGLIFCGIEADNPSGIYLIDTNNKLFQYNIESDKTNYIYDLNNLINKYGEVNSIIKHHNDLLIGFKTSGLFKLSYAPERDKVYDIVDLGIYSGIFCLLKDKFQDIIWIGSDGEGAYMYSNDSYSFKNAEYANFAKSITSPARSLFLDKNNTLWVGTKGDGILKISNFDNKESPPFYDINYINTHNSELKDNSVYAFEESKKNIMWIGSEEGLSYYSYANNKINVLELESDIEPIKYIHAICELNDSTLWIASVGLGIVRAHFSVTDNKVKIKDIRHIKVKDERIYNNFFFTIYRENEHILWFGNRGNGVYKVDNRNLSISNIMLESDGHNKTQNDIYAIIKDEGGNLWLGTGAGLIKKNPDGKQTEYNTKYGFLNNTIHGILQGENNTFWLSTNKGLIRFNIEDESFQLYSTSNGLKIMEYSGGAIFKDKKTNTLFFGGINGFVSFSKTDKKMDNYYPKIQLDNLTIYGENKNIVDYINKGDDNSHSTLTLNYDQNFFTLSFAAPDYINGINYVYYYKLDDNMWINNGSSNKASFTDISPGKYILSVKYLNKATGVEGSVSKTVLIITPPWYLTNWATTLYGLLTIMVIYLVLSMIDRRNKDKSEKKLLKLSLLHKEDSYESKLQFFTNIAHEFFTPLTLIYGPCNQILSYNHVDNFVAKHASLIQKNTEKLNYLIQELIEFNNIDSGMRIPIIENISINAPITNIIDSFGELFNSKEIIFIQNIEPNISWNTDVSFLYTIITNLLSNAYAYTSERGIVQLNVYTKEEQLVITISNTGKGMDKESIDIFFDRYRMLDAIETQSKKGVNSRNRLGLAISNKMVEALGGKMSIDSIMYDRTLFEIELPLVELSLEQASGSDSMFPQINPIIENNSIMEIPVYKHSLSKKTILIIDNDLDTLIFIGDIFSEEYNVIMKSGDENINDILFQTHPDIILSDFIFSSVHDLARIKEIKDNKATAHIPLIIMSTQNSLESQIKSLDIGVEMFISKPFNIDYIKKSVKHLISRKNILKDYFNSPLAAFDLSDNELIHKGTSKFMQEITEIIEQNITNSELSTKFISEKLNISSRHLYRKLKDFNCQNPVDIIRNTRMHTARNLLLTTQLTVEEIIYKSGFGNKSTFFRLFSEKYDITPQAFRQQEFEKAKMNNKSKKDAKNF